MPIFSEDVRKGIDKGQGEGLKSLSDEKLSLQSPKDSGNGNAYYSGLLCKEY